MLTQRQTNRPKKALLCAWKSLISVACSAFPFLLWPTLLACSGRASVTATSGQSALIPRVKICKEQGVPVDEWRLCTKKRMAGENAEDVGLTVVEEVKRCMFEAFGQK